MKKVRHAAVNVIMFCLAAIMLLSAWKLYTILKGYSGERRAYDKVSEAAELDSGGIDFDALRQINPDVIGWIRYEDSPIDYPVVMGSDNEKYLHTMFDGSYGACGTLFADAVSEAPFEQFNTIIYGHHMRDGSMFGSLKKLKDKDICREHPQMELITPSGRYHLLIWAFLNVPSDSDIYKTNIEDAEERAEYISDVEAAAEYITDVNVTPDDRLAVLSTCAYEYDNARYVVIGKTVPWKD